VQTLYNPSEIPENYTGIVEYSNGIKSWLVNGKLHRTDGPAVEHASGTKIWFFKGKQHRIDGPALEYRDDYVEYWYNGKETTKEALKLLCNIMKLKELKCKQ
jgi:hypothetical protein